MITSELNVKI